MDTENIHCYLVQTILEAALLGKPYPGQVEGTTFFPDIEWVVEREEIILLDRFLTQECALEIPGYTLLVLTEGQLRDRAAREGTPYFSLSEVDVAAEEVTLSLELRWMAGESEGEEFGVHLGGGGVRVRFERVDGEWQAPAGAIATWIS